MPIGCRGSNPKSEIRNLKLIRGFTLIEVLVFIVIAGILLPAIVVPFATAVRGSTKPERVTTAMYLAHYRMEALTKFAYGNGALNPVALTPYANTPIPTYQWQWQITYVDSNFNASATNLGYKQILVRVRDPENATYEIYSVVTNFP
jgi:prepilin-type N-terminal cleavage/methylation domain-containing protein